MKRDYRKWQSPALDREMELLVFGERGRPVVVFPTSMGRFYQWEDFGMIAHLKPRIDEGLLQLWCVDSVDSESFYNKQVDGQARARRHLAYDRYVTEEVVPAIRKENIDPCLELLGASFGAFHAVALATRHPGIASRVIGLSGAYDAAKWLDGFREQDAYFANPLAFLPGLADERLLRAAPRDRVRDRDRRRGPERRRVAPGRRDAAGEGRARDAAPVERLGP